MFQTKVVVKIKTHFLYSILPTPTPPHPPKSCRLRDNVEKYSRAKQVKGDNTMSCKKYAICMPDNYGKNTDTYTRNIQYLLVHNYLVKCFTASLTIVQKLRSDLSFITICLTKPHV